MCVCVLCVYVMCMCVLFVCIKVVFGTGEKCVVGGCLLLGKMGIECTCAY